MNKKGLAMDLMVIIGILFLFSFSSLLGVYMWTEFESQIDVLDSSVITDEMKSDIDRVGGIFTWPDKIFTGLFVILLLGFLISASTWPADEKVYLLVYIGLLLIVSVVSMILSNGWVYISNFELLQSAASTLPTTDFVLRFAPIIVFLTGLIGGVLFYTNNNRGGGGVSVDDGINNFGDEE